MADQKKIHKADETAPVTLRTEPDVADQTDALILLGRTGILEIYVLDRSPEAGVAFRIANAEPAILALGQLWREAPPMLKRSPV